MESPAVGALRPRSQRRPLCAVSKRQSKRELPGPWDGSGLPLASSQRSIEGVTVGV